MGLSTTLYTMFGGVQAVTWTDVKQMVVIFVGIGRRPRSSSSQFPDSVSIGEALNWRAPRGGMKTVDYELDLNETYTLWSG